MLEIIQYASILSQTTKVDRKISFLLQIREQFQILTISMKRVMKEDHKVIGEAGTIFKKL